MYEYKQNDKKSFLCSINLHVPITCTAASVPQAQENGPTLPDTSDYLLM